MSCLIFVQKTWLIAKRLLLEVFLTNTKWISVLMVFDNL